MRQNIEMAGVCVVLVLLISSPNAEALSASPYVYLSKGDGDPMSVTTEYEIAYSTRESRFFGSEGFEQGLRLRFQPWSSFNMEAWGGVLIHDGSFRKKAASFVVNWLALNQADHQVDLHLGLGYLYDYRADHVPSLRATLGHNFGRLEILLGGLVELPKGSNRDEADIILSLAGSYGFTDWYRQGLEFRAEDIEGLWDPQESEGGAKFLVGPTAYFEVLQKLEIKINAALVFAYLQNQKTPKGMEFVDEVGFMCKVVLGYSF